ncbi:MAG: methionyl-tRNA formyltransferase [Erysipelotrichaceae bacterium]
MNDVRIIFMGTPVFGKEILRCLVENNYNVIAVVSQPDKKVGRKQIITFCPVKQYALEQGIKVIQPIRIKDDFHDILDLKADLIVTCAYGQLIPDQLLKAPRLGCINVHASLLPKLRGGAPIQHSIMDGYDKTGITIMEMVSKMDAGDIISQREIEIDIDDTYSSLHDKLIEVAAGLLIETMPAIINQSYVALKQDEREVTYGFNITKEEERIDLNKSYLNVYNQIRGLSDNPCCYGIIDGKKVKLHTVKMTDIYYEKENGTIIFENNGLGIVIDNRLLLIEKMQLEGKTLCDAAAVRNGAARNWEGKVMC